MIDHEQRGEYVDAERCRVEWEHRKEELTHRQLYEMDLAHKRQKAEMNAELGSELKRVDQFWADRMGGFAQESQENVAQMVRRHQEECLKLEEELGMQLSTKVKESSELLNLHKMEEQMAKQKNYVEAHRVQ